MSKKIVFLKGSSCVPCKQFEPVFDKLTAEFNLPVEKRTDDVDSLRKFGLRTVPAVVLVDVENGREEAHHILSGATLRSVVVSKAIQDFINYVEE